MLFMLKLFILIALIQLLYRLEKPFVCSGIYAGITFFLSLAFESQFVWVLVAAAVGFVLASIYFWLLNYFKDGLAHWGILVGGLLIGLV